MLLPVFALLLGAATITRVAIALEADVLQKALPLFAHGVVLDAAVSVIVLAPIALAIALGGGSFLRRAWFRHTLVTTVVAAAIFGSFVEYFFFEEFNARFNHVALDYLLFPGEVIGNVWESYPLPLYVVLALAGGVAASRLVNRGLGAQDFPTGTLGARLGSAGAVLLACTLALAMLRVLPPTHAADRRVNEVASNGLVQLARAFHTAGLDYESYYRTVGEGKRAEIACLTLGWPSADDAQRTFPAVERRDRPLDVVVILGESFGSEFVGRLGGRHPCAPGLERWADRGLFLTNVVPTGNRTVRGLEGVLCSFVPLPGDSIWKRSESEGTATIARVLGDQGYRTEFLYGGDGAFDRMRSFALKNGWNAFFEDSVLGDSSYPKNAFRTIWGVADETLFEKLIERQRLAHDAGVPFFGTALTVSNHKPFLTPDGPAPGLRPDKLKKEALASFVLLAASFAAWRIFAARSRGRVIAAFVVAWVGFGACAWTIAQPRGSRTAAVRYADRALAQYFDRARAEGLLDHTVVLFVGDHGARVYGSEEIPTASYRVPALFLAPDAKYVGKTISRLCSQIDLAPTLLSLAGVDYVAPFFGKDLLKQDPDGPGRAYVIHNRNIGLLTDTTLTVLGLQKSTTCYARSDRSSDSFERVECDRRTEGRADAAAAVFQCASSLYESGRYRVLDAP
ncbi:MAG: LTA synthase family protein [Planctomycetota bacterium]